MNISRLLNFSQTPPTPVQAPKSFSYSGRLWSNYINRINSTNLSSSQVVNTVAKIVIYLATVSFIIIATPVTLVADAVRLSFNSTLTALDKLKHKFAKEEKEEVQVPDSNLKKIAITSVSLVAVAAVIYGLALKR